MSEVPTSLEALKVGFGISIVMAGFDALAGIGSALQTTIEQIEPSRHIGAAEHIRASSPKVFETYGQIAARMLDYLPDDQNTAIASLMSDINKDLYGIQDLLGRNVHPYFTEIFRQAPLSEDPAKMQACFEAVAAFGRGE